MTAQRFVPWTPEEDKLLTEAVVACGPKICWKFVAKSMSGRDNKACRKRWIHSLDPGLRKGRWTTSEDAALLEAVGKHGKRWYEVAKDLPGRTDDQCAKRYKDAVDPSIRRDPWTKEEDELLWEAFQRLGNKWHAISSNLSGRPAVHCRNRLQSLQRLHAAEQAANDTMELEGAPQLSGSPVDSPLSFLTPSEGTSPPSMITFEESIQSPSASSLASWPPTPPSEPAPTTCVMASPSASHSLVPVEEIRCSATADGSPGAPPDFSFHEAGCVPGLFENASGVLGFGDPIRAGFWGSLPSRQPWTSSPSAQLVQNAAPPSTQGDSNRIPSPVDNHGSNRLPCPGSFEPPNMAQTVSDAMTGTAFTMTCPLPHCYFQCQTILDMWKHVTWTHVRPNSKDSGIESIVERVVLGGFS